MKENMKRREKVRLIKGQAEGISWEKEKEKRIGAEADLTLAKLRH